ncbi:tRNA (guanine46-N7-)-methyltransferase [Cutibacterium acnes JCM 18909]|nr:tRNA (guanine46-N7-)-methyltransferase [Cutibacterium acnes JCM 18909]
MSKYSCSPTLDVDHRSIASAGEHFHHRVAQSHRLSFDPVRPDPAPLDPTDASPAQARHHQPGLGVEVSAGAHRSGDRVRRGVVSFVRRSPRMNVSQQRAMNTLASTYLIDVPRDATSTSVAPGSRLDLPAIFGRTAPLTVEIGVGSGDVLAALAVAHPERDFIGFEVYLPPSQRPSTSSRTLVQVTPGSSWPMPQQGWNTSSDPPTSTNCGPSSLIHGTRSVTTNVASSTPTQPVW